MVEGLGPRKMGTLGDRFRGLRVSLRGQHLAVRGAFEGPFRGNMYGGSQNTQHPLMTSSILVVYTPRLHGTHSLSN